MKMEETSRGEDKRLNGNNNSSISMNKTALAIEKIAGIKMTDANGQMRDTFEILSDIGKIWDTLSKDNKSALAEAIAGI